MVVLPHSSALKGRVILAIVMTYSLGTALNKYNVALLIASYLKTLGVMTGPIHDALKYSISASVSVSIRKVSTKSCRPIEMSMTAGGSAKYGGSCGLHAASTSLLRKSMSGVGGGQAFGKQIPL